MLSFRLNIALMSAFLFSLLSTPAQTQEDVNLVTAIEQVAEKVGPAVVSIRTETTTLTRPYRGYSDESSDIEDFNDFFAEFFGAYPEYERKSSGLGSGVIIAKEGYILTNEHVVSNAYKILVTLADRRSFAAQLKGTDSRSDLAVIKIDAPNLPVATLGNSENLKIGQWVVAIGNPFGHILDDPEPTVTQGVISALHRALPVISRQDSDYSDLIQTDAAINPGNSGGPLVNLHGEIVGINAAIFSTSGGYQGMGFAVPINYAKAIVDQICSGKKIESGWIGIGIQDLDDRLVQYFSLKSNEGVLINRVLDNAPAKTAGLQEGDIILSANGIWMRNTAALLKYIGSTAVGKTINFQVLRDRKEQPIAVIVGKRPELTSALLEQPAKKDKIPLSPQRWRGMEVRDLPKDLLPQQQLPSPAGVLVADVNQNSAAQEAGIRKGDIIVAINKQPISNVGDFQNVVQASQGPCLVRTLRGHFVVTDNQDESETHFQRNP